VITYHVIFFCSEGHGKLTVFSVKAMLATMCGGKILDKLRCKYFQANQIIYETFLFPLLATYVLWHEVLKGNCCLFSDLCTEMKRAVLMFLLHMPSAGQKPHGATY